MIIPVFHKPEIINQYKIASAQKVACTNGKPRKVSHITCSFTMNFKTFFFFFRRKHFLDIFGETLMQKNIFDVCERYNFIYILIARVP